MVEDTHAGTNGSSATRSPLVAYLERLHATYAPLDEGEVASYIPELSRALPDWFGIAVATPGGAVYEVGDTRVPFTLQSVSKPLTYGLALADRGDEDVRRSIGLEPSGDAFNAISLDPRTGIPLNPMINAGAIAATALVQRRDGLEPFERIRDAYSAYAGRALDIDLGVYRSESATGHRNRAIAHLLRASGVLGDELDDAVDTYFRQCSVSVNCRDLAVIGATLASGGQNPLTGARALDHRLVRHVLSVMTTCGMYDFAGEWLFAVGLPAKSGVSGGVLAVLPGRLGIGVFSPPLDARGNSVRGVRVCTAIASDFDVHLLDGGRPAVSPLRTTYTLATVGSKRIRSAAQRAALDVAGATTRVIEVQGELELSAVEQIAGVALDRAPGGDLLLDISRVTRLEPGVVELIEGLVRTTAAAGGLTCLVTGPVCAGLTDALDGLALERGAVRCVDDVDAALEACEDAVLERAGLAGVPRAIPLRDHQALRELDPDGFALVSERMTHRIVAAGELVVRRGDPGDAILFLTAGQASVLITQADGHTRRAATVGAGALLGDLALLDRAPRSADVRAEMDVEVYALPLDELDALALVAPVVERSILRSALRETTRIARRLEIELAAVRDRAA